MVDIVDPETRSRMMSQIRSSHTRPEIAIRQLLHRQGFRYRLHVQNLAGKPDIVLPRYGAVIFVHGCFWHGHDCPLFRPPGTRQDFWQKKMARNRENDRKVQAALLSDGWRIAVVWECAVRGKHADLQNIAQELANWLRGTGSRLELRGSPDAP